MISAVETIVRRDTKAVRCHREQTLVSLEEGETKCIEEGDAFEEEHVPDSLDHRTRETSAAIECREP